MTEARPTVAVDSFFSCDIRTGTIIEAGPNEGARKPAYVMRIDFGDLGIRTTSAQITDHYGVEDLVGRQVVAVVNFPPRRIAGVSSEVLVLGAIEPDGSVVLLGPTSTVDNGLPVG